MLTKSSHELEKEGIFRIRLVTDLQWTGSYTVYLGMLFLSKLSNDPDFVGIAPALLEWASMSYWSFGSSSFQCIKISKNIFQSLLLMGHLSPQKLSGAIVNFQLRGSPKLILNEA